MIQAPSQILSLLTANIILKLNCLTTLIYTAEFAKVVDGKNKKRRTTFLLLPLLMKRAQAGINSLSVNCRWKTVQMSIREQQPPQQPKLCSEYQVHRAHLNTQKYTTRRWLHIASRYCSSCNWTAVRLILKLSPFFFCFFFLFLNSSGISIANNPWVYISHTQHHLPTCQ